MNNRTYTKANYNSRNQRRIQKKKQVLLAAIILCVTLMAGCIFAYAKTPDNKQSDRYKYFTSYEIQPGDTLYSIANQFITDEYRSEKEYIDEVRSINKFRGDMIYAGSYIVVPYYAD